MSLGGSILQHEWLLLLVMFHVGIAVVVASLLSDLRARNARLQLRNNELENLIYFGSTVLAHRPYDWALEGAA